MNAKEEIMVSQVKILLDELTSSIGNDYHADDDSQPLEIEETGIRTWFERDRQHIELYRKDTDETIVEWWDDEVSSMVDDGYLKPDNWHDSAYEYALDNGLIPHKPGMQVTIASNDGEEWTYQTGDNSFTGSCYHCQHWGVGYLYRDTDTQDLAESMVGEVFEAITE